MGWYDVTQKDNPFHKMPKVELHRHLEGSLRFQTLVDIASEYQIEIPGLEEFKRSVQIMPEDQLDFANFLSKFLILRKFYTSPEVIRRVTREAVEDAARDNIRYMEMRFTPVALSRIGGFDLEDVMSWVSESAAEAASQNEIRVRLIVSVNRHEPVSLAESVLSLAKDFKDRGVVGVDLAGNEAEFSAVPFLPVLEKARNDGLYLTLHAGEWSGADNVSEAIRVFAADRIGHGVRVVEDADVLALAAEKAIPFEVCVTSNVQSGVTGSLEAHPVRQMIEGGVNVTINTDDPGISQITLSDEFLMMNREFGYVPEQLNDFTRAAIKAAFLDETEKKQLEEKIQKEYQNWLSCL